MNIIPGDVAWEALKVYKHVEEPAPSEPGYIFPASAEKLRRPTHKKHPPMRLLRFNGLAVVYESRHGVGLHPGP